MVDEIKVSKNQWLADALKMFARLSIWIVWPLLAAILIGNWLDQRHHSGQFWFYILVAVGFIISIVGLITQTLKYYKEVDKKSIGANGKKK